MSRAVLMLQAHELRHALLVGLGRDLVAKQQGRTPWATEASTLLNHIIGAVGELTVAKALGVYWNPDVGGNDHSDGDVAGYEVRTTFSLGEQVLPVKDNDDDNRVLVLVTGDPPCMTIAGWMLAREARAKPDYLRSRYGRAPRYYVPVKDLHPWAERPLSSAAA